MKMVALYGPRRGGVKVFKDTDRHVVRWRVEGMRYQRAFAGTREGRIEAEAFARGLREGGQPKPLAPSVGQLWQLYATARFPALRPKSQRIYRLRWRLFEEYAGHVRASDQISLEHVDEFVAEMRRAGRAPNQIALHVQVVRLVYRWARTRKLLVSDVPEYRLALAKEERRKEPSEYRREDFEKLVAVLDPQSSRTWRPWAVLMLIGHQGVRVNAALSLKWDNVSEGRIHWPADTDKMGRPWSQPIRDGALSALLTALDWRERDGYAGPWVFYSPQRRGQTYKVQALWQALRHAERRAGVPHLELRALHGLRRMVARDVADETGGDLVLAGEFIGDRDPRVLLRSYLRKREDRLAEVAERLDEVAR